MARGEQNRGRDAEREDVPVVDAQDLAHGDVPASKFVMNVISGLNRLFLLAVMATSAVGCKEKEHAHAKDFAPPLDPNENQCIERDPNISHYDCQFVVSYGKCIGIPKDTEAEKFRMFNDSTLAVLEKWNKRSPEERQRDHDAFANFGRRLLDNTPQAAILPGYSTVDKDAATIRLPNGFTFPGGSICPEGEMIFWTPRRIQKAK